MRIWHAARAALESPGAAQQRGPHPCTAQDKREQREHRGVARHAPRSQSRAHQRAVRPRATDVQKTWGGKAGRAARRCRRRIKRTVCDFGAAQAALEAAERRNNAGRILARRTTRASNASNVMWRGAWRDPRVVRNSAPRGRGRRMQNRRRARRPAKQRGVTSGEAREQFATSARNAGSSGSRGVPQ